MRTTVAILVAAALSGAAGLCYEIVWTRALVVPLGNSADATTLVLAGFMLGMAAGARLGGALAERARSAARAYAALEGILAACAIAMPRALGSLSHLSSGTGTGGALLRYGAALALVTIPCLAMGATLPLLVRVLTATGRPIQARVNLAYGVNTLGAAAGAFATGFWGIAAMGVSRCSWAGAAASTGAALLAWWGVQDQGAMGKRSLPVQEQGAMGERSLPVREAALAAGFVSGMVMLSAEVLWARVLTFVFGHDTYAFAALLAFVLLGLAIGGLAHRLTARLDHARVLAALLGAMAVALTASLWMAAHLVVSRGRDPFGLDASRSLVSSVSIELYRALAYTPVLVLAPCVLAGAVYPAACSVWAAGARDTGRKTGAFALSNGVGATTGALVSAFGLIAWAGIERSFLLLSALTALAGVAVSVAMGGSARLRAARVLSGTAPALAAAVLMPGELPRSMLLKVVGARHQELLHYDEGRTGTISVTRNRINGEKILWVNAVNEVTTRLVHDQSFKLLGHLGPLLHPSPRKGVMICLGAGLSAGAALTHPLERLDVVDLSSSVAGGAGRFADENNHVLDNPRLHLHVEDGRQFLLRTVERYDVAIIDSTHPKSVDSWILYTREFFELVSSRLAPGGIVVQWLPLHGLSEREFKIVVRTFLSAFPEMTLWANAGWETHGHVAYAKLVGVKGGQLSIDVQELARRVGQDPIRGDLAPWGMDAAEEILDLFVGDGRAVESWVAGLPVQSDDNPIVPYATAYSRGRRMTPGLLAAARSPVGPLLRGADEATRARLGQAWYAEGLVLTGLRKRAAQLHPRGEKIRRFQEQADTVGDYHVELAARYPHDADRLFEAGTQLGGQGHPQLARPVLEAALAVRPRDFRIRLNLALVMLGMGDNAAAIASLSRLRAEQPGSAIVLHNLGAAMQATGDVETAVRFYQEALMWDPDALGAALALAPLLVARQELDKAEALSRRVIAREPYVAEAHDVLGLVVRARGKAEEAIAEHRRATALDPFQAAYHHHLGLALQDAKRWQEAEESHLEAMHLMPEDSSLKLGWLGAIAGKGKHEEAAEGCLQVLEQEPDSAQAAWQLGLALEGQGRKAEAKDAFCLAAKLGKVEARARCGG